ncbi:MAG: DsbA family protein [Actinomycetes bacterium]
MAPGTDRPPSRQATPTRRWLTPLLVLVGALALAATALLGAGADESASPEAAGGAGSAPPADARQQADDTAGLARREEGDPMALGAVDAPVVMIEWADFQCPFCGRFARETKPELVERYVEAGILRIEWRDFPYLGEESWTAALAGRAAAEQGRFWEFHDAVYAEEIPPNSGELTRERLMAIAEQVGMDTTAFADALDDPAMAEAVRADATEGQALGVTGTPTFLIGDQPVVGAQPLEVFTEAIEDAAAAAGPQAP